VAVLNSPRKKFIKYLLPTYIWALAIFFVSSIPGNKIPRIFSFQDVIFHILEYAIFGWLINRALKNYYPDLNRRHYIYLAITISFIYALTDEFHQAFVPYRNASILDVSLDTVGAIISGLFSPAEISKDITYGA